ncbi:MAG: hypothetical protein CMO40_04215 [Verrucomicrobiaceae bacterium]|nr:hypothetical protein [Verrucomicrobiaceae bacterium]
MQRQGTILGLAFSLLAFSSCEDRQVSDEQTAPVADSPSERLYLNLPTELPEGWELEPGAQSPRVATYRISAPGDPGTATAMAITRFPGSVGGLLANVNRWLEETGLAPLEADGLEGAIEKRPLGQYQLHLVVALGEEQSTLGAILPLPDHTWFLKLSGSTKIVSSQQDAFRTFVGKLSLGPSPPQLPPPPPRPTLSFTKPARWRQGKASVARLASFRMGEPDGPEAQMAIIPLRGSGGPEVSFVNQWRTLVGLEAVTEDELPELLEEHEFGSATYRLADFTGKATEAGESPRRILVAYTREQGITWFFKMIGHAPVVEAEKPVLLDFLRQLQYSDPTGVPGTSPASR